jgi:hypothetical protein
MQVIGLLFLHPFFEITYYIKKEDAKEDAKVPSLTSSVYEYQLWKPDLGPQFKTPI